MKRKSVFLTLVLALAMVVTSISSVFAVEPATGPATDVTKKAIKDANVHISQRIADKEKGLDELTAEWYAIHFQEEVAKGKYKVIGTKGLVDMMANNPKLPIIDTMPAGWWTQRHIPGAYNQVVGGNNGPEFKIITTGKEREDTPLLALAKKVTGAKQVTKWYNKKTKKWVTKRPAKKYRGKSKKVWINKDKPIVVYCGFTGCARSHQAAMFLRKQGFTNVYRYVGGIAAWVDAGNDVQGSDIPYDFPAMSDADWAEFGIDAGEITNSDYIIDVRPDKQRADNGFVPGAKIIPVTPDETTPETIVNAEAFKEAVAEANGKRIVVVCVSGNKLARNALNYLQTVTSLKKVTYLKGGFGTWSANYPVVSPDKKSVTVDAVVNDTIHMNKYEDQTHHVLVNENGKNAPVALLNTKALPLQVYKALQEIGGTPCDNFNKADCFEEDGTTAKNVNLPEDAQKVNVNFEWKDGEETKTAGMSDFFQLVATKGGDNSELVDYVPDMRFGGCMENIEQNFDSKSGNLTGCITCTFSCWIGTVSNAEYAYSTNEAHVNRANVPAAGTHVTVVYTLGE